MPHLNLIPTHRRYDAARRRRIERWTFLIMAYALVLLAGSGLLALSPAAAPEAFEPRLDAAERRFAETQSRVASLHHRLAMAERTASAKASIGAQPNWAGLLMLLAQSAGSDIVLSHCHGQPPQGVVTAGIPTHTSSGDFVVRLIGYGRSQAAVSHFVLQLERSSLFDSTTLATTRRETLENTAVFSFEIDCAITTGNTIGGQQ